MKALRKAELLLTTALVHTIRGGSRHQLVHAELSCIGFAIVRSTVAALSSSNEVGSASTVTRLLKSSCSMPVTFNLQTKMAASSSTSWQSSLPCQRYVLPYLPRQQGCVHASLCASPD